jgi:hypothetical protein
MKITLNAGSRGYLHTLSVIDIADMEPSLPKGGFGNRDGHDFERRGQDYSALFVNEDETIRIRQYVDIRTNGRYLMSIHLSFKDVMFLSWIVFRNRCFNWIVGEFARVKRQSLIRKEQRPTGW